ncbi:hypothetical protein ABZS88_21725 [Streptomyces sp. NPDC005480]|uniref:hypothetical protein n=1 Tax=Streptomyces sp. NPDC005480 TaxID=3154880 RepID=UPI0033B1F225
MSSAHARGAGTCARSSSAPITPHVAGGSAAFRPRAERLIVEQIRRWAAEEELLNLFPRP